jgi:Protein of unknown function (DUF3386)
MRQFLLFCAVLAALMPIASAGEKKKAEDPAATKLLAEARAARAEWTDFPGFSADLAVNDDGKIVQGKVNVTAAGKVNVELADKKGMTWVRRELASLVAHRLPLSLTKATPCAFVDDNANHPSGRAIRVLSDELHSSYRVRDRQIGEVNRTAGDVRFTITILENATTKEKKYLPISYVVTTWDVKSKELKSSRSYHHKWKRMGAFDFPESVLIVTGTAGQLEVQQITLSNVRLSESGTAQR